MRPGEVIVADGDIVLNPGRERLTIRIENTGDRPVQIGSHIHLPDTNSALDDLVARHPDLDLVLIESGGDNLTATFSPALADVQLFVIDVAGGDKVPRKGGPGIVRSDLLVINKTDLAALVGADLDVMRTDAERARGERPTLFTSLAADPLARSVAAFIEAHL